MPDVRDNPAEKRFELTVDGHVAAAYYKRDGNTMTFVHTEVPAALGGRGIGSQLAKGALEAARARDLKVVPLCPFIAGFISKHPEFGDLVQAAGD